MYRLAFKLRLNSHKPYMGMAKLRMDQNQLDEAGKMLAQFGEGETDKDPEAHYVVGRYCLLRKEFPGACVCFAKALELDPLNKKYLDAHHHVCIKLGWFDESKAKLKAFLEANPDSGLAMSRLAALELDHGDPEAADEMIERGRRLHPDHAVFKGLEKKAARLARASDSTPAAVSWSTH
jgi:tetratricopeptide (TPR) repeat protein